MKIVLRETVLEAARKRMAFIFDEFEHVYVSFSGGKDSTVIFRLALEEARRRDRLPLKVLFVDQEAEWGLTIDYVREIMSMPEVEPYWLQIPIRISNSASVQDFWLMCWSPEDEEKWMRPQEPNSIKENVYGTDRFKEMFHYFLAHHHDGEKACTIAGMRAEESRTRWFGITSGPPTYKHVHWAMKMHLAGPQEHYTFYPIYDWALSDVWKFIHESGVPYCRIYDYMYQYGVPLPNMRVSNLHHETAIKSLYYLQEIEQDTWDRLCDRLGGVHVARNLDVKEMFEPPKELPWMFRSWAEYRDFLLDKLITNPEHKKKFAHEFARYDRNFEGIKHPESLKRAQIGCILANDFHLTKLENWASAKQASVFRAWKRGDPVNKRYSQWIPDAALASYDKVVNYT